LAAGVENGNVFNRSFGQQNEAMKKEFTAWQRAALAHPFDVEQTDEAGPACIHKTGKARTVILTCDIDAETARTFGAPVWHVSVWPPNRNRAEAILSGVGEGEVFEEAGVLSQILHLRRRMRTQEMARLDASGSFQLRMPKRA
jgi:hypothetical protein